jgi:hypothetical protein
VSAVVAVIVIAARNAANNRASWLNSRRSKPTARRVPNAPKASVRRANGAVNAAAIVTVARSAASPARSSPASKPNGRRPRAPSPNVPSAARRCRCAASSRFAAAKTTTIAAWWVSATKPRPS